MLKTEQNTDLMKSKEGTEGLIYILQYSENQIFRVDQLIQRGDATAEVRQLQVTYRKPFANEVSQVKK